MNSAMKQYCNLVKLIHRKSNVWNHQFFVVFIYCFRKSIPYRVEIKSKIQIPQQYFCQIKYRFLNYWVWFFSIHFLLMFTSLWMCLPWYILESYKVFGPLWIEMVGLWESLRKRHAELCRFTYWRSHLQRPIIGRVFLFMLPFRNAFPS